MLLHSVNARRNSRIAGVLVLILCLALCCVLAACGSSAKTVKPTGNGTGTDATSTTAQSAKAAVDDHPNGYPTEAVKTTAYKDDYITFEMPLSWSDSVEAYSQGHTSDVFSVEFYILGSDKVRYPVFSVGGKANDASTLGCTTTYGGKAAETVWEMNNGNETGLTPQQQEDYLLATTGGQLTREAVIDMASSSQARSKGEAASDSYLKAYVVPSVKLVKGASTSTTSSSTTASANSKSAASTSSSGMHSDTKIYSVDLPAYWNDRVIVNAPDAYGTTLDVRSKKYPDYSLCTVEVVANEKEVLGGDIGKANVKTVRLSDGRVACLWAPNYGWLVASGSEKMTSAEAAELVDLSTGGKTVADCEKALKNGNNSVTTDWIAENVKVTAK